MSKENIINRCMPIWKEKYTQDQIDYLISISLDATDEEIATVTDEQVINQSNSALMWHRLGKAFIDYISFMQKLGLS